jgi:two-component system, NtrC family, response regulator HydG
VATLIQFKDMARPERVLLVVDDEPALLTLVDRAVAPAGFHTRLHTSAREALARLDEEPADVALVDLQMAGTGGIDVLRAIKQTRPECAVILMTGQATLESAIEAVKLGALDCLSKPLDLARLRQLLDEARADVDRRTALLEADSIVARRLELCGMIGRSPVMQQLFGLVRRIAPYARTALVTGETGTGKQGVARAIHALGPRARRRFVTLHCSAVAETQFEGELFGHVRGACTHAGDDKAGLFEAADGGSLFLDEVGALPLPMQGRLLRALETGEVQRAGAIEPRSVDVRVTAATSRDLRQAVQKGRFRADLFYRLSVVELTVPPLRERREDIPYLTAAFVREFAARFGKAIDGVGAGVERMLTAADWTGNVRELRHVIERACMRSDGPTLTARDVEPAMPPANAAAGEPRPDALGALERGHIARVLQQCGGNKCQAAERLGISRRTLYRRLDRYRRHQTAP